MKTLKYTVYLFLILPFFPGCSTNDDDFTAVCTPVTETSACTEDAGILVENFDTTIVTPCITMVDYIPINRYDYIDPVFNPNNENEIIFIRTDYESSSLREVMKYNFCTDEVLFITDKAFYGLDWSSKDWVIFTGYDQQLYKIKSNGDSLTQLTNNAFYNSNAKWNSEGTAYLYRKSTSPQIGLLIADEYGNIQDTLAELIGIQSWAWDYDKIVFSDVDAAATYTTYGEYKREMGQKEIFASFDLEGSARKIIGDLVYRVIDNRLYWTNVDNLSYHDLNTNEITFLTEGFDNRRYGLYDISPTSDNLILSRGNLKKVDICTIETENKLYLIDITGEREREIVIPE